MKQLEQTAITTDLVLIGGGHSHLFVLRHFAMNPIAGLRITLVTRDLHTPYSGMLPGYIAGHYSRDEVHIDLQPLARWANCRIIHGEVVAMNADARQLHIAGRPSLNYDLLSINIGSRPQGWLETAPGVNQVAIKPVDQFIKSWRDLEQRLIKSDDSIQLAVIGGGAGGVELALSLFYRVTNLPSRRGQLKIVLVTDRDRLLPTHNEKVQRSFSEILRQRSIQVHYHKKVESFDGKRLRGSFENPISADVAVWATHARAAGWLADSGLQLDANGFIAVNADLSSCSHDNVFAAGDIASVARFPRPKSGVFAVRQGLPLSINLARAVNKQPLREFKPQLQFLSLISSGNKFAVASRGSWMLKGRWCWWLKDSIDRRFMRRFSDLPLNDLQLAADDQAPMRCAGCGSKLGRETLESVLSRIAMETGHHVSAAASYPDDAAVIAVPEYKQLVQTVDQFRSFVADPYLFGKITANHAMGDLFAMGVTPHSALVLANVEFASAARQAEDLYQLMSGVMSMLQQHGTLLVGGHSAEAAEMSCGLSLNGFADPGSLLLKSAMQPGQVIILTRALGSGILFAADMQARARGDWIDLALAQMQISGQLAADCLRQFGATACTDVTGFGVAGHLYEMARASQLGIELVLDRLPLYSGVVELAKRGITSSLHPQNSLIGDQIEDRNRQHEHPAYPVLFDPQTAGGLLASLPAASADACLQQLWQLGYHQASVIARVAAGPADRLPLALIADFEQS